MDSNRNSTDDQNERDSCSCDNRCCSVSAFFTLLVFSVLFLTFYGFIHGLFENLILSYSVEGAFAGVYIILILDLYCSIGGVLACTLDDGTKSVLVSIFVILCINCLVNGFVGIFISTGIKKFLSSPVKSRRSPTRDCTQTFKDVDCRTLSWIQISMFLMYLQLLIRVMVLAAARKAFFIEPVTQRRGYGSYWTEHFARRRAQAQRPLVDQPTTVPDRVDMQGI